MSANYRTDVFTFHSSCTLCRLKVRSKWKDNPLYSPGVEAFWKQYLPSLQAGARARRILFGIDVDDLIGLYLDQQGVCSVSGLELNLKVQGKVGRANTAHLRPSVDRIDSHGNYTIGNVQIVAQVVNMMKGALPQQTFIEICGAIARHNMSL